MKVVTVVAVGVLLAGCQLMKKEETVSTPQSRVDTYVCKAEDLDHLVGFSETDVVLESLPGPVRVLRPNSVATMDKRYDRINLHVDENEVITKVTCG